MAPLVRLLTAFSFLLILLQGCKGLSYYEYYAPNGTVTEGLVAEGDVFTLNGKPIRILSGALHYFRVHPAYWRDIMKKIRAAGLNTVETYMPWNLHEPMQGVFDMSNGTEAMSPFLDLHEYLRIAQEEDLFVILRPGPYICAEWDFGGMPSYLLKDYTMQVRSYYEGFRTPAAAYLKAVLADVPSKQFTKGGSIIAVQVENEFGHFGYDTDPRDTLYLEFLRDTLLEIGLGESLLFTSDTPTMRQDLGAIPGVLQTANFNTDVEKNLATLKELQPNRPLMVMEFWTGWFDHWLSGIHATVKPERFADVLERILQYQNCSVNMYMFIGGTSFGFMAGANTLDIWPHYAPDVSSYDYDAVLTEAGDYTAKYNLTREILAKYNPLEGIVDHPEPPPQRSKVTYPPAKISYVIPFSSIIGQHESVQSFDGPVSMEELPINNNNGQAHGYILYSTNVFLAPNATLKIRGHVRDMAQVMVDGELITKPYSGVMDVSHFGFWNGRDKELTLPGQNQVAELSILVENLGRVNYGKPHKYHQKKGLWEGPVLVDGMQINEWKMTPLEFKKDKMTSLTGWENFNSSLSSPAFYWTSIEIGGKPEDTWLDMRNWGKGVVFVNGFNLGRYWHAGPTKSLYLPAPLMRDGANEFLVFEQYTAASEIVFSDVPILH